MAWPTASESGGTGFDSRRVRLDFVIFNVFLTFGGHAQDMFRVGLRPVSDTFGTHFLFVPEILRTTQEQISKHFRC